MGSAVGKSNSGAALIKGKGSNALLCTKEEAELFTSQGLCEWSAKDGCYIRTKKHQCIMDALAKHYKDTGKFRKKVVCERS